MNEFYRPIQPDTIPPSWDSYTVIVACVGAANVAQLTCDLLIHNLKCELFADVTFKYLPPVVGPNPYNDGIEEPLMTCCQLYVNHKLKLAVLQTRSRPFSKCRKKHVGELVDFLRSSSFYRVILLSSSFAAQCKDSDLMGTKIRYAVTSTLPTREAESVKQRNWELLSSFLDKEDTVDPTIGGTNSYSLSGVGIAGRLFTSSSDSGGLPLCWINYFTSEGDNVVDALLFVHHLNEWLSLLSPSASNRPLHEVWVPPSSWSMLFGNSPKDCLY